MDFRFDYGMIVDRDEYLIKRAELQAEFEKLQPAANTDLLQGAADLIDNFKAHFEACGDDIDAQNRLVSQVVERVFVQGREVVAVMFKRDIHAVLHYGADIATLHDWHGNMNMIDELRDGGLQ